VAGEDPHDALRSSRLFPRRFFGKKDTVQDNLKTVWLSDLISMQYLCHRPLAITIFGKPDTQGPLESLMAHYSSGEMAVRFYGLDSIARDSAPNRPLIKYLFHIVLCKSTESNAIYYISGKDKGFLVFIPTPKSTIKLANNSY